MKKISVHLGSRSYTVLIGRNLLSRIGSLLKPLRLGPKILMVTNRRVARLFLLEVRRSLIRAGFEVVRPHLLARGNERDKSKEGLLRLWEHMARVGLDRTSTLLALGGGVVGDLAGFAASTYMRGISLIQVPTTLLAQVDAAIGGKTAINLPSAKNVVGTFYQPRLVIADVAALRGMGQHPRGLGELKNSFAEIIKYGIIEDLQLFHLLEERIEGFFSSAKRKPLGDRELSFLETVVWRSAQVKARVVEADERELKGRRMILNYGHTFGHALEAASHYRLPHGEAVVLGMVCAARLARKNGLLRAEDEIRQKRLIQKLGLPTQINGRRFPVKRIMCPMLLDKKKKEGRLQFVLPVAIGRVKVMEDISLDRVRSVLFELGAK